MQSLESKTQEAVLKIIKMCTAEDIKTVHTIIQVISETRFKFKVINIIFKLSK